jgi:hypothetical protein
MNMSQCTLSNRLWCSAARTDAAEHTNLKHYDFTSDSCRLQRELFGNKTVTARLNFAVLLKAFQFEGRFLERREDIAFTISS